MQEIKEMNFIYLEAPFGFESAGGQDGRLAFEEDVTARLKQQTMSMNSVKSQDSREESVKAFMSTSHKFHSFLLKNFWAPSRGMAFGADFDEEDWPSIIVGLQKNKNKFDRILIGEEHLVKIKK